MGDGNVVADQTNKKNGKKNFRWSAKMDKFLILYLVECAKNGDRCHGNKFNKSVYQNAAKSVEEKFTLNCTWENVNSHLKTVKARYSLVKKLRAISGWGWDDTLKMITVDPQVAADYIEVHPDAKNYINVPLDLYDEMSIVCGEDQATGGFAKSINDGTLNNEMNPVIDNIEDVIGLDEIDTTSAQDTFQQPAKNGEPSSAQKKYNGKRRPRQLDEAISKLDGLTEKVSDLANAMRCNPEQEYSDRLFSEVMKTDSFHEDFLTSAFDYLNEQLLQGLSYLNVLTCERSGLWTLPMTMALRTIKMRLLRGLH